MKLNHPLKIKRIEFGDDKIFGCCPTWDPPEWLDLKTAVIERCPSCDHDMYVTPNAIKFRSQYANAKIYCFFCLAVNTKKAGIELDDIELIGFNEIN